MYDESSNHYGNAAEVLELRLKNIRNRIEEAENKDKGKGKSSDDDPLVKDRKELAEIEDLLPEVLEKVGQTELNFPIMTSNAESLTLPEV